MDLAVASGNEGADPVGVAECFVNYNKDVRKWGAGHVDDTDLISMQLVRQVLSKCVPMSIFLKKDNAKTSWGKQGRGHGGFICREVLLSSPGGSTAEFRSVYPVTAKHNLRHVLPEGDETRTSYTPSIVTLELSANKKIYPSWDELGWEPTRSDYFNLREGLDARPAYCKYSFDMSVGGLIEDVENPACLGAASFRKVRQSFKPEKGQKVGIAIRFTEDSRPTPETIVGAADIEALKDLNIDTYYGQPGHVNIYTGEIKYVGPKHIEYSINSFTGCSGAVVFLLDQNQPDSVDQTDWGKAIAVHSGAHPLMDDRNYGFLINKHPIFANY